MGDRSPKISVRVVASTKFYEEGRKNGEHDGVMILYNENDNLRNDSDQILVCFGKVMTFSIFAEKLKLENIQSLGEGKALTKGNFNNSVEVCFVQCLDPYSEDREDSNGVGKALNCITL